MTIAEGVSGRVVFKPYSTGIIQSGVQPVSATDPGTSAGQILRRVSSTLKLAKDTYQSAEIRSDRQIGDYRHGVRRVTGGVINGELSPGTYWDFLEAVLRSTDAAPVTATNTDLTSVALTAAPVSTAVFASGDAYAKGFRIGDIINFGSTLTNAAMNNVNFMITSMSADGRTLGLFNPNTPLQTMGADTTFTMTAAGRTLSMASSGFVPRKFAIEHYFSDLDIARLFTEVRMEGFNIQLPASGMATIDITGMGRDMEVLGPTVAPFFTAPTVETTSGIFAAVNGALYIAGTKAGVVTGLNIQAALSASSDAVVGQNFVPEVFLGRLNITGQATVMLENETFINYFLNETEISIVVMLTTSVAPQAPAMSITLPRVKFGDADAPMTGEGAQILTMPFQALKNPTAGSGLEATTIRFCDTVAV